MALDDSTVTIQETLQSLQNLIRGSQLGEQDPSVFGALSFDHGSRYFGDHSEQPSEHELRRPAQRSRQAPVFGSGDSSDWGDWDDDDGREPNPRSNQRSRNNNPFESRFTSMDLESFIDREPQIYKKKRKMEDLNLGDRLGMTAINVPPENDYRETDVFINEAGEHQQTIPGGQTGINVPGLGVLPSNLKKRWDRYAAEPDAQHNRGTTYELYGYNLPRTALYEANVNKPVKPELDAQYGGIIDAVQSVLGTRTNPTVWDGKIATEKAVWDKWIGLLKRVIVDQNYKPKFVYEGREGDVATRRPLRRLLDTVAFPNLDSTRIRETLQGECYDLGRGLIDFKLFFNKNVALTAQAPVHLCVTISLHLSGDQELLNAPAFAGNDTETLAIIRGLRGADGGRYFPEGYEEDEQIKEYVAAYVALLKMFPHLKGKVGFDPTRRPTENGYYNFVLKLRTFTGNTKEMQWGFSPRYGPFDQIFKLIGSYSKNFISTKYEPQPDVYLDRQVKQKLFDQMKAFYQNTKTAGFEIGPFRCNFDNWVLLVDPSINIDQFDSNIKSFVRTRLPEPLLDYYGYLRSLHTLAKWFNGKKKQLQLISQQRVQNYLDMDKRNLGKVYQFFGSQLPEKKLKK